MNLEVANCDLKMPQVRIRPLWFLCEILRALRVKKIEYQKSNIGYRISNIEFHHRRYSLPFKSTQNTCPPASTSTIPPSKICPAFSYFAGIAMLPSGAM